MALAKWGFGSRVAVLLRRPWHGLRNVAQDIPKSIRKAEGVDRLLNELESSEFDALGEQGSTLVYSVYAEPWSTARSAAATHFLSLDFSTQSTTDFFLAGEVEPLRLNLLRDSQWRILGRYGLTVRPAFGPDHMLSAGTRYLDVLAINFSMTHESGFASGGWRPGVSFALRIGRYTLGAARGSGVNDVSGTYRITMNVQLR